jgi:glycosyltransferase involved in cell wall biosynthesis
MLSILMPVYNERKLDERVRLLAHPHNRGKGAAVQYCARSTKEGKKLTAVDGLRVVATLLGCRFSAS